MGTAERNANGGATFDENGINTDAALDSAVDVLAEWADVEYEALPLDEVACIEYDRRFSAVFGLLAAVRAQPERSARGLRLAKEAISLCKAHVSAWQLREECASALAARAAAPEQVWRAELAGVGAIIMSSAKNYQAWNYRRVVVEALRAHSEETMFIDVLLDADAKNYHAWAHRQWLFTHGVLQRDLELAFVDVMLDADVRNNSAWNHRWLLVRDLCAAATLADELATALLRLPAAPRNEALWGFAAALVRAGASPEPALIAATATVASDARNVPARRFLVLTASLDTAEDAAGHCDVLAGTDIVRAKYWAFRSASWRRLAAQEAH